VRGLFTIAHSHTIDRAMRLLAFSRAHDDHIDHKAIPVRVKDGIYFRARNHFDREASNLIPPG
jgi:hypothetical protein